MGLVNMNERTERKRAKFITDHALLRYMERAHGFNITQMKAALVTPELMHAIRTGEERITLANGYEYRIGRGNKKGKGVVTTIVKPSKKKVKGRK